MRSTTEILKELIHTDDTLLRLIKKLYTMANLIILAYIEILDISDSTPPQYRNHMLKK